MIQRTDRLNSLLQEVIAEVIMREIRNPKISKLITIKKVEITKDLHYAKVYVSMLGSDLEKKETLKALKSAAGYISTRAAKKVVMRYFPSLTFHMDDTLEDEIRIHSLLEKIHDEQQNRPTSPEES
ncbi:MAG: 30S ribosome-binding factor RbfA [Rhabdochlamydiaceae bacterium]|nr:30S ribosome-binding factor RbfA [Rhabdochlamydiaceae bacterium]